MKDSRTRWLGRQLSTAVVTGLLFTAGCGESDSTTNDDTNDGANDGANDDTNDTEEPKTLGNPISANDDEWTWVPIDGANCRDGSQAGIVVNPNSASSNLMIFLEGGGACFNSVTCVQNPKHFDDTRLDAFLRGMSSSGILNRENAENPVADWNFVFVPYCTGDVFAGREPNGKIFEDAQVFVGYSNFGLFLKRIVPTFPELDRVLLTGVSAGGFGAAVNYPQTAQYFAPTPVSLLDDSGPAMPGKYLRPCLQELWKDLWKLDETVLAACGDNCPDDTDFLMDYFRWMSSEYPDQQLAIIESMEDGVISMFFGFGKDECSRFVPLTGDEFSTALTESRIEMKELPNLSTFFFPGSAHTTLMSGAFYTRTPGDESDTTLVTWVTNWLDGKVSHVGP